MPIKKYRTQYEYPAERPDFVLLSEHFLLTKEGKLYWKSGQKAFRPARGSDNDYGRQLDFIHIDEKFNKLRIRVNRSIVVYTLHNRKSPAGIVRHRDGDNWNDHPDNLYDDTSGRNFPCRVD